MPTPSINIAGVLASFQGEIDRLIAFDAQNQTAFSSSTTTVTPITLSIQQLEMLTESIFFKAFRLFENFIRDTFMLYCIEEAPHTGDAVESYLKAQDVQHAEQLVQSSMQFLEWNSPDIVIQRAELYLKDGFPLKDPYSSNKVVLDEMRLIRNHIAHNSPKSSTGYNRVVRERNAGVTPITIPAPGTFLLQQNSRRDSRYNLLVYLTFLKSFSGSLA